MHQFQSKPEQSQDSKKDSEQNIDNSHEFLSQAMQSYGADMPPDTTPMQFLVDDEEVQKKDEPKNSSRPVSNGSNTSLPKDVKSKMENSFGTDFSQVNIHKNDEGATQMGALAYTQGSNVHFAPGQYNPGSQKGQELLGHELTHVVQQREGRVMPMPKMEEMQPTVVQKTEKQLEEEKKREVYKQAKAKGTIGKMQYKMQYKMQHGKDQLNRDYSKKHFNNYVKGEIAQMKRNRQNATMFRSKANNFERQLSRESISFGSEGYIQRAKASFPGFDPVSSTMDAMNNAPVSDSPTLEQEADTMGKKAAEGKSVDVVQTGKGVQKKDGEKDPNNKYESYKNKTYSLSKDSKLSNITEKEGKESIDKIHNKEKKFSFSKEVIPKGLKVKIVASDFSYEKSGKKFVRNEVAQVTVVDESNPDWNNRTVWTTRKNISQEADDSGNFKISKGDANTRKAGVEVKGAQKTIPKDTKVELTDHKTVGTQIYVRAIDKETKQDYGWINVKDLGKDIYNESFGLEKAKYISEAANHSTINRNNTLTYKQTGFHYPEIKEEDKRVLIKKGDKVKAGTVDGNYIEVSGLIIPGHPQGWTHKDNLKQIEEDSWEVTSSDARLRSKETKYAATGKKLSAGQFVIEKETSLHSDSKNRYVKVGIAEKKDGQYIEKEGSESWVKQDNLTSKWADSKGKHASWSKGKYTGQIDTINVLGAKTSWQNGKKVYAPDIDTLSKDLKEKYDVLDAAASTDGYSIMIISGFRSYPEQKELYDLRHVRGVDTARPGRSNHQSGIAIDINTNGFDTDIYKWMKKNASKYGFIRTVNSEDWHWEYRPDDAKKHGYKMPYIKKG